MAVGNYLALDRSKQTAGFNVTEFWNGSRWLRLPAAGPGGGLTDVSCTSASRCMAVGEEPAGQVGTHTIAERWNGRRWRVLVTRNP